jgi:hypothetical protein
MTFYKTIVCLANSRKEGGRCVAGKEIVNNQLTHNWIRPVSSKELGELSEIETLLKDGKSPKLLDVITIPFLQPKSHVYQTENYLIDNHRRWVKRPPLPPILLPTLCDSVQSLWVNDYHSTKGKNDKIPFKMVTDTIRNSLLLIKPDSLTIKVSSAKYDVKTKVRAHFIFNNQEYDFAITDFKVELAYEIKDDGDYLIFEEVYLCISLGEPFYDFCYKLVASIIFLNQFQ